MIRWPKFICACFYGQRRWYGRSWDVGTSLGWFWGWCWGRCGLVGIRGWPSRKCFYYLNVRLSTCCCVGFTFLGRRQPANLPRRGSRLLSGPALKKKCLVRTMAMKWRIISALKQRVMRTITHSVSALRYRWVSLCKTGMILQSKLLAWSTDAFRESLREELYAWSHLIPL